MENNKRVKFKRDIKERDKTGRSQRKRVIEAEIEQDLEIQINRQYVTLKRKQCYNDRKAQREKMS